MHGQKKIQSVLAFYKRKLIKTLLPLYIYYVLAFIILSVFGRLGEIKPGMVLCQLLSLRGFIDCGIGNIETVHLWFITFILMCYLITPILQWLNNKFSNVQIVLLIVFISIIEILFIMNISTGFMVWLPGVILYMAAYFAGSRWKRKFRIKNVIIFTLITIACVILRIITKIYSDDFGGVIALIYDRIVVTYTHCILAVWISGAIWFIIDRIGVPPKNGMRVINTLDKYSYCVYIVHQMFLAGVLSAASITTNMFINTLIFLLLTVMGSILIYKLNALVTKLGNNNKKHILFNK